MQKQHQRTQQHNPKSERKLHRRSMSQKRKVRRKDKASELLELMQENGLEPNVITFNAAISACEKLAQYWQALKFLRAMRECGLEPDVIMYSTTITACVRRCFEVTGIDCKTVRFTHDQISCAF